VLDIRAINLKFEFIMNEKRMNEVESLELITSMINDSRARMRKNFGTPFLVWGYTTVVVSIVQALIVACVDDFMPYLWLWGAIPLIGWPLMLCLNKQERGVTNYIDRCVGAVWTGIGIASVFIPFYCGFGVGVFPTIVVLMGVGTYVTAVVIKDKLVKRIGVIAIISPVTFTLAHFVYVRSHTVQDVAYYGGLYLTECIIFAVIIFMLLVVPGHILNRKKDV
jgi:hypothetical protein